MKSIIKCFFLLFTIQIAYSQDVKEIPERFNYFQQKELQERLFTEEDLRDTTKDRDYEKFLRWDYFYKDRIDRFGDLRSYPNRMFGYYKNQHKVGECKNDCYDCCFPSDWQYLGPRIESQNLGRIDALWINPSNSNHILAGAAGGLWKTLDGGVNWEVITDFCLPSIGIKSIAVQPNNLDIIYVSTGFNAGIAFSDHNYGFGLFKTTDGGINWTDMNLISGGLEGKISRKVTIHPVNHNNVYVAIGHEIYKTVDGGSNWQVVFGTSENPNQLQIYDFEILTNGLTDEVYVSSYSKRESWGGCNGGSPPPGMYCWGAGGQRFYSAKVWKFNSTQNSLSTNGLVDLTDFSTSTILPNYDPVTALASISITSGSITIGCQHGYDAGNTNSQARIAIYRKPTGGSWTLINDPIVRNGYGYDFPFEVSPSNDNVIYIGVLVLGKSINGGSSYTTYNNTPISNLWSVYWAFNPNSSSYDPNQAGSHPDVRFLTIYNSSPSSNNDIVFFGTDGGISKTTDGGTTTKNLNGNNLELTQFFGLGNSEILPNLIYGGTQDNGIFENKNQSWRNYPFGDAYDAVIDKINPSIAYVTVNGSIRRTSNGGANWSYFGCPEGNDCWLIPLFINNNNELYAGIRNLWKRVGTNWVNITNLNAGKISGIDMSEDGNIAYIAYSNPTYNTNFSKKVYKISNLNTTPIISDISSGLSGVQWQGITDVATDDNGNTVWVCFGNFWEGNKKIYKYNSGIWSEYGQGLPDIPCNNIEHYKGSNGVLFLATDDGVYYRDETMVKWEDFRCALPKTIISDLEINYELNRLRASTYSRGIWETPIPPIQDQINCISPPTLEARVSPSATFNLMTNNQTRFVNQPSATVNINVGDICQGGGCCSKGNNITWKVFRNGSLYSSGSGETISFSGEFQRRFFWFSTRRFQYRVEITSNCGGTNCGIYNLNFRG